MLRWSGSLICLDIKRELIVGYRASRNHRILPFDPTSEQSIRFNPLAEIRVGTKYAIFDCQRLANVLSIPRRSRATIVILPTKPTHGPACCLCTSVYRAHVEKTPVPSLRDVYEFMNSGEHDRTQQGDLEEFGDICQPMIEFDHGNPHVNNGVATRARHNEGHARKNTLQCVILGQ